MTGADRSARIASWLLSLFATLAIVGAVASVSNTGRPTGSGQATETTDRPAPRPAGKTALRIPPPPTPEERMVRAAERQAAAGERIAGWLEAVVYALIALVAVVAVLVLAFFRSAGSDQSPS